MSRSIVNADIIIVGGGAAGLATAIFAARLMPKHSVLLLDGARRLGAKILVSGGGRCNVTNRVVTTNDFCGGSANVIKRVLREFPAERTVEFFRELGVDMYEEEDNGKLFPVTDRARTVLDALLAEASRRGVRILTEHRVAAIRRKAEHFEIDARAKRFLARRVVLATGGRSLPKTGSDGIGYCLAEALGHTLVPTTPALVALILNGEFHSPLSGISHLVELIVRASGWKPIRVAGVLLWTHFGVSGPAVLDASRHWHRARAEGREVAVYVNFLPGEDLGRVDDRLRGLAAAYPRAQVHNALAALLPARVATALLENVGILPAVQTSQLSRPSRQKLAHALVEWPLPVRDSRGYSHAEVTAGGVPLSEVDPRTMMSRTCPGLYFVGEILDVDGRIGGFNFQWAWSSAHVAASGLAREMRGRGRV